MPSRAPAPLRVIGRSMVDWWDSWLDMVMMILVGFLASLTVVLFPVVIFGIYYVVHSSVNGESLGVRGMIEGGRKYFWKAIIWGVINLIVIFLAWVNITFYSQVAAMWGVWLLAVIVMLIYMWIATNFYALPYFMEQNVHSLRMAFRNGLFTTLATPLFTLIMVIMVLLVSALCIFVIPIFLALPGIIPTLGFRAMYDRLETFGKREKEKTPKEIEAEKSSQANSPSLGRAFTENVTGSGGGAPEGEVLDGEGDVKKAE